MDMPYWPIKHSFDQGSDCVRYQIYRYRNFSSMQRVPSQTLPAQIRRVSYFSETQWSGTRLVERARLSIQMKRYNLGWFFKYPNGYIILGIFEAYIFWGIFSKTIFKISKMDIYWDIEMSNLWMCRRVLEKPYQKKRGVTYMVWYWENHPKCCDDRVSTCILRQL